MENCYGFTNVYMHFYIVSLFASESTAADTPSMTWRSLVSYVRLPVVARDMAFGGVLVIVWRSLSLQWISRKSSVDACIKLHGARGEKKRAEYLPMFTLYTCDSSSQDTRFQVSTFSFHHYQLLAKDAGDQKKLFSGSENEFLDGSSNQNWIWSTRSNS